MIQNRACFPAAALSTFRHLDTTTSIPAVAKIFSTFSLLIPLCSHTQSGRGFIFRISSTCCGRSSLLLNTSIMLTCWCICFKSQIMSLPSMLVSDVGWTGTGIMSMPVSWRNAGTKYAGLDAKVEGRMPSTATVL